MTARVVVYVLAVSAHRIGEPLPRGGHRRESLKNGQVKSSEENWRASAILGAEHTRSMKTVSSPSPGRQRQGVVEPIVQGARRRGAHCSWFSHQSASPARAHSSAQAWISASATPAPGAASLMNRSVKTAMRPPLSICQLSKKRLDRRSLLACAISWRPSRSGSASSARLSASSACQQRLVGR